ncbi:MAG: NADP-dependent oxidoreductase [Dongiaceae bacterium]
MNETHRRILLRRRPAGWVTEDCFELVESPLPKPGPGEALVRMHYLSVDPYMRGQMDDARSYVEPTALNDVMPGDTVGEIVHSNDPKLRPGQFVHGYLGWQTHAVAPVRELAPIDPAAGSITLAIGPLGMIGATAWIGLMHIGQPKPGETVVVSAAAGAVGSLVGQLAREAGCRTIGIAGGPEKYRFVTDALGFDQCVDYKSAGFTDALAAATPDGIDIYFENVGGAIFDAVLPRLRRFARVPVCGLISRYNSPHPHPIRDARPFLVNRIRYEGFICTDRMDLWPKAHADFARLLKEGRLVWRESVAQGIENAPAAFISMLKGGNIGKQLVKLIP